MEEATAARAVDAAGAARAAVEEQHSRNRCGTTESGVLKLDADGNPASLDFHIMGDPNPALESVAYSNYKADATIDPSVFTLPDVCHQGTANRYHGGGARQALDLLLRR